MKFYLFEHSKLYNCEYYLVAAGCVVSAELKLANHLQETIEFVRENYRLNREAKKMYCYPLQNSHFVAIT